MPDARPGLGRIRPPDWEHVEQYPAASVLAAAGVTPPPPDAVVRHQMPQRYDQGPTPRCVDFGSCTYMSALELANQSEQIRFRPGYLYRWAVRHDGIPGDPGGTTVRAGMDYVRKRGLIPTKGSQGRQRIAENRWCQTMDEVLATLYRQPVPIGVAWYSGMMQPDAEGFVHRTGRDEGGHFITLSGLNMVRGYADLAQTWGPRFWTMAPTEAESWDGKIGLDDLEPLLFRDDGEAVVVTDYLERIR